MFDKIEIGKGWRRAVLALLAGSLGACAGTGFIEPVPAVQVAMSQGASEAQLIRELQAQGYDDVRVTELLPNRFDEHPELMQGFRSADDPAAQATPVHPGWNGTAAKGREIYNVYVTPAAPR
jgi:hypothetical protein